MKLFSFCTKTIERARQRLVEEGLEAAINRAKAKKVKSKRLDGEQEAHLVALACSELSDGNARWALRLLADRMVELEYVDSLSHETVRQALKKMKSNLGRETNGAFFLQKMQTLFVLWKMCLRFIKNHMTLNVPWYVWTNRVSNKSRKYVNQFQPSQANQNAMTPNMNVISFSHLLIFFDPLAGWLYCDVTDQRTAVDWAYQIRDLLDVFYPEASLMTDVMDNLNTHCGA